MKLPINYEKYDEIIKFEYIELYQSLLNTINSYNHGMMKHRDIFEPTNPCFYMASIRYDGISNFGSVENQIRAANQTFRELHKNICFRFMKGSICKNLHLQPFAITFIDAPASRIYKHHPLKALEAGLHHHSIFLIHPLNADDFHKKIIEDCGNEGVIDRTNLATDLHLKPLNTKKDVRDAIGYCFKFASQHISNPQVAENLEFMWPVLDPSKEDQKYPAAMIRYLDQAMEAAKIEAARVAKMERQILAAERDRLKQLEAPSVQTDLPSPSKKRVVEEGNKRCRHLARNGER